MADKEIKARIDIDPKPGVAALEDVADAATDAQAAVTELDGRQIDVEADTTDAQEKIDKLIELGEQLEKATIEAHVAADTDEAEAKLKAVQEITEEIEKLAPTIDPEAKIERAEGDLKTLKSTADDLEKNPPTIAPQIDEGAVGRARQGLDDVGKSADSSKSVLANMVGNSVQDIGVLGGVAGSAGVAIGQMGEYMADALSAGEGLGSVLKSFGAVAGPLAGIAALTLGFQYYAEANAKAKQEVEDLRKAQEELRDGDQQAFVEELAKQYSGLVNDLDAAGISQQEFIGFVRDGTPIDNFAARLDAAGFSTEGLSGKGNALAVVLGHLRTDFVENEQKIDDHRAAQDLLAAAFGLTRDQAGDFISITEAFPKVLDAAAQAIDEQNAALAAEEERLQASADALAERMDAQRAAADAQFALRDATDRFADSLDQADGKIQAVTDSGASQESQMRDIAAIYDEVTQNAAKVADETVRIADEQATASGTTLDQQQKTDLWNGSMITAASTANGPLRQSIIDYVAQVNGIPPEKVSDIQALIDQGLLAEAEAMLEDLARDRQVKLTVAAAITSGVQNVLDAIANGTLKSGTGFGESRAALEVSPRAGGAGEQPPVVNLIVQGSINGDDHLRAIALDAVNQLARVVGARRRPT